MPPEPMSGAVQCPGFYFLTKYLSNAFKFYTNMPLSSYFLKRPLKMEVGQGCGAGMWTLRFLIRLTTCLTHALFNFSQTDLREHTSLKGYLFARDEIVSSTYHRCKWESSAKDRLAHVCTGGLAGLLTCNLRPFEPNPHFVSSFVWQ